MKVYQHLAKLVDLRQWYLANDLISTWPAQYEKLTIDSEKSSRNLIVFQFRHRIGSLGILRRVYIEADMIQGYRIRRVTGRAKESKDIVVADFHRELIREIV